MSPKIEKIWGTVFGQTAVRRKDSADRESSARDQTQHEKKREHDDEEKPRADRQSVEKAMADLRSSDGFGQTGMRVEAVDTAEGLKVRLLHGSGSLIKMMSAEEFMRLRESAAGGSLVRGKILDQKF